MTDSHGSFALFGQFVWLAVSTLVKTRSLYTASRTFAGHTLKSKHFSFKCLTLYYSCFRKVAQAAFYATKTTGKLLQGGKST